MPTLRDHLAKEDLERKLRPASYQETGGGHGGGHHGGGHHGGGHHGGGHHGGGRRHGGAVFYDRSPDVIVVTDDCPPGFYFDEFGNCRPLPYHSANAGRLGPARQAPFPASRYRDSAGSEADAGHFDTRMRPIPCPDASGDSAVPVGWFNPFDPYGSGYSLNTKIERNKLDNEITQADARIAAAGAQIPANVLADYVSFRKDWAAIKDTEVSTDQLNSMRARFRTELDALADYIKVADLQPPAPLSQTIPNTVERFSESMQSVAAAGAVTVIAVVAIAAYLLRPHLGKIVSSQTKTGASLARSFAK